MFLPSPVQVSHDHAPLRVARSRAQVFQFPLEAGVPKLSPADSHTSFITIKTRQVFCVGDRLKTQLETSVPDDAEGIRPAACFPPSPVCTRRCVGGAALSRGLTARGRRDPPARRGGGPRTMTGVRQQTSQCSKEKNLLKMTRCSPARRQIRHRAN